MKRIFALLGVVILLFFIFSTNKLNIYENLKDYNGTYYFYTSECFANNLVETTPNGCEYIVSCSFNNINIIKSLLNQNQIRGESFCISNISKQNSFEFLKSFAIQYYDYNLLEILAFSPLINYKTKLDNKYYNMQIIIEDSTLKVGFPLILGGF